jgi:hypothetical protein
MLVKKSQGTPLKFRPRVKLLKTFHNARIELLADESVEPPKDNSLFANPIVFSNESADQILDNSLNSG